MKKPICPSLPRRLAALILAVLLAVPTVYAAAGEQKLQTVRSLADGLDYVNTITYHPSGGRTESFALDFRPGGGAFPIMLQSSGTIYSGASINKAVEEAQSRGYHVLGAVNTDFFFMANGVPMGIVIEDGAYLSSQDAEAKSAVAVSEGRFELVENPSVSLSLFNQRSGVSTQVRSLNKNRAPTGGLYLLDEHFSTVSTRTSTPGWMVRMERVDDGKLTVNGELTLRVTELIQGSDPVPIGEGNYILTAADEGGYAGVFQSFQEGDLVTVQTQCDSPELIQAQWACGAGDIMVRDGQITDSESWTYVKDGRAPRTALGVRADGSVLIYTVDGRQSGYSGGLSQKDLAQEMLSQGCVWAVNLDGGGSTAMSIWVPGQAGPGVVSRPSDGRPRSCATYLLFASADAGSGRPDWLALQNDGLAVLSGTSVDLGKAVVLDSALNPLDTAVSDVTIRSQEGLGEVEDTIYTAGSRAGTDTLLLRSSRLGIQGSAQIHVVDSLTELNVLRQGTSQTISALSMKPGEQTALDAQGSYWSRPAMRSGSQVVWEVTGDVGSIDENGVFTAAASGSLSGSIIASAGGISRTIPVTLTNVHIDVDETHWAYVAVEYCYENQLVSGVTINQFGPNQNIRRGDFLLMLYRAAGSPPAASTVNFPDVSPEDYYADAIAWAQENGLASGMADGTFAPGINVTREQAFTILNRCLPVIGIQCQSAPVSVLDQFRDRDSVASWAAEHAAALVANQIVGGSGGRLNPQGNLTRAEMAVLLYKLGHYEPTAPEIPDPEEIDSSGVDGIAITTADLTLQPGEAFQLTAALSPQGVSGQILWSIDDSAGAACVDAGGTVTNVNTGTEETLVTVTASCNGFSSSCLIRCLPAEHTAFVAGEASVLNVRSGPGTDYPAVDHIIAETPVLILESLESGWLRVLYRTSDGLAGEGYVSADYIIVR